MKKTITAIAFCMLSACSPTPTETLIALSQFDLLTADYAQMGARIEHPTGIEIQPGGALILLQASRGDGTDLAETIPLTATANKTVGDFAKTVTDFAIAPNDVAQIETFRTQVSAWEDDGHDFSGSVTVSVQGCKSGTLPDGPLLTSVKLKLSDETGYLPFRKDIDLRELTKAHLNTAKGIVDVDSCEDR